MKSEVCHRGDVSKQFRYKSRKRHKISIKMEKLEKIQSWHEICLIYRHKEKPMKGDFYGTIFTCNR